MTEVALHKKPRPKYLNFYALLFEIRLPPAGFSSIFHRISGAALFLLLPLLIFLLDTSLSSEQAYATFQSVVANPFVKVILLGLIWSYMHHLCHGVRALLLDLNIGIDKKSATTSAFLVFAVSLSLTAILGATLLW